MKIYNKPVTHKNRGVSKMTNYYHRFRTLKNYDQILRLVFYKNKRFMTAGLYYTKTLKEPDICIRSWDSRSVLKNFNKESVEKYFIQFSKEIEFGKHVANSINQIILKDPLLTKKRLILDLGARKKRRYFCFVEGYNKNAKFKLNQIDIVPETYKKQVESFL